MHLRKLVIAMLALAPLAGCSRVPPAPMAEGKTASVVVTPADGATDVRLDAPVSVRFGAPVERAVVERGLSLVSEYDMTNPSCPESLWSYHGSMAVVMGDSGRMEHMDEYHAIAGHFAWNADGSECRFQPDSMMRSLTGHMIHIDHEMARMMESRLGSTGGMAGHGMGTMSGDMMLHFTTMDSTLGGHSGHH